MTTSREPEEADAPDAADGPESVETPVSDRPADFATGAVGFASRAALQFPVVGVGASAGGLQAFTSFFDAAPNDTGMAFVLIQHLPPSSESMLAEILARH